MNNLPFGISGLSHQQVIESRARFGQNSISIKKEFWFLHSVKDALKEPMLLLLVASCALYFLNGSFAEAIFMIVAIVIVTSISIYQESRSRNALEELKSFTQPKCKVIRDHDIIEIASAEIVVGDYIVVEEGVLIPADGEIVQANDFSVNESILTGESMPVMKTATSQDKQVYQGTLVISGLAICLVTQIGINTKVGQIGKSLQDIKEENSPLQIQIHDFVKKMAFAGGSIFIVIWLLNFLKTRILIESLLKALTLAMSILPEEIPVAFATFMALGAWRLMKLGIIVKDTKTVETLGSATVICIDKTGTITKNDMSVKKIYVHSKKKIFDAEEQNEVEEVVRIGMWASEPIAFDPMERALHHAYEKMTASDLRPFYKLVHEYPLSGRPPLMTHVFKNDSGHVIIAAKGAPEALLALSELSDPERSNITQSFLELASEGYRVLGVGEAIVTSSPYPKTQHEFKFNFLGLIGFYDPPKENIKSVLQSFYHAGIKVKIITGDNAATTRTIANQIAFAGADKSIAGDEIADYSDEKLAHTVDDTNIYTRMFPEAKLRVIKALKGKNHIVAMTGDGVNDGPALKAAHIGIAMGKKGSEIAKQASALILADDDLGKMVDAVAMGRKIYGNLKKAIQYIISIHIPIILIVFIPLLFGWVYPSIFTPVHIIFLELIMGPTCSIIYENEPMEKNVMDVKPRPLTSTFFNIRELSTSMVQGLVITLGLIGVYWYAVNNGATENKTAAMVFVTLVTSNILLTLVNRSFFYSIFTTLRYKNNLIPLVIAITLALVAIIFALPAARSFFRFDSLTVLEIIIAVLAGVISVIWFELYKAIRKRTSTLSKTGILSKT